MPSNQCLRCLKEFKYPYLLKRHEERKTPCKQVNLENNPKIIPNNPKTIPNNPKIIPKSSQSKSSEKFACKHCKKLFQSKNSYYKHKNELRCKEMSDREQKKILIHKNNKVLKKKQETNQLMIYNNDNDLIGNNSQSKGINGVNGSNNVINSNNNIHNNIQNNNITIKINPFGQENTDFLTKEEKLKIINRCYMSVPALIETIHNHPENRNFYISNKKNGVMAILNNDNETEFNDYNEICSQLIEKNMDRLDDYFTEFKNELKESVKSKLQNVVSANGDYQLNDKYVTDIKYYLMNISRRNKKELTEFIDKLELQLNI
jgi:hypothetical protein